MLPSFVACCDYEGLDRLLRVATPSLPAEPSACTRSRTHPSLSSPSRAAGTSLLRHREQIREQGGGRSFGCSLARSPHRAAAGNVAAQLNEALAARSRSRIVRAGAQGVRACGVG